MFTNNQIEIADKVNVTVLYENNEMQYDYQ